METVQNQVISVHENNIISVEATNLKQINSKEVIQSATNDRNFNYRLDEKSVRLKLLKGAKRIPIEIENKKTCSNINLSDGTMHLVVKPWMETLAEYNKSDGVFKFENEDVRVASYKPGYDKDGNHVDTKIVLASKNNNVSNKYTLHIYNSTQRIKIDGKNFDTFTNNILEPYFANKVDTLKDDIVKYINKHQTKFIKLTL